MKSDIKNILLMITNADKSHKLEISIMKLVVT